MLYELTAPQYAKMLQNLNRLLDKGVQLAETKKFDVDVLLNSRLAPDQFNLIRQIQIATDTAKLSVSRLTGKEAPKHEDNEKTLPELKARIESVIQYLNTFKAADFNGAEERKITQPRWEGKYLLGAEYAQQHALPNFYFHVTTAYSILRHNGVDIGKKDYLGDLPLKA
ncbi:MAG: DUF1993 domain-containing protein [Bdellovibrionales bacterium]|nr:DUF1993 domain-containing protein [Bdellovibrionales bacterium]